MKRASALFLLTALCVLLPGCAGGGKTGDGGTAPPGTAPVSVLVRDTPPAGVTVVSFEVTLTGAVLQPGNISLVSAPIRIEIKRLEVETAFLSTADVPAGTYTSVTVTFANPELTILNNTGSTISLLGVNCANNAVCEFEPGVSGSASFTSPQPITILANQGTGLLVDVNVNNVLQDPLGLSFTGSNVFSVTQLPVQAGTGQLEEIEDLLGRVANSGAESFDLQTSLGTLTGIRVDTATQLEDFTCNPVTFANCVENGQAVEVDLRLFPGGILRATKIELEEEEANEEKVEGTVVSIDQPNNRFQTVVVDEIPDIAGLEIGSLVTVTVQTGAGFRVDDNGLLIPVDLPTFDALEDLLVGQNIQVRRRSGSSGTDITTDRVRLRMSRFTAQVSLPGSPNFAVGTLPSLFTSDGITTIEVRTSAQTGFDPSNLTAASLSIGNRVSLRGLLFRRLAGSPVLVAQKVRRQ